MFLVLVWSTEQAHLCCDEQASLRICQSLFLSSCIPLPASQYATDFGLFLFGRSMDCSLQDSLQHVHESIIIVHNGVVQVDVEVVQLLIGHEGLHVFSLDRFLLSFAKLGFLDEFFGWQVVEHLSSKGHDGVVFKAHWFRGS